MKNNKFRTVNSKPKLSVHAKLPKSSFHYILGYVESEINQYSNQNLLRSIFSKGEYENFELGLQAVKGHLHQGLLPKISIVDSEVNSVRTIGDNELLFSTATLRCWVESLIAITKNLEESGMMAKNRYSSKHRECPYYRLPF